MNFTKATICCLLFLTCAFASSEIHADGSEDTGKFEVTADLDTSESRYRTPVYYRRSYYVPPYPYRSAFNEYVPAYAYDYRGSYNRYVPQSGYYYTRYSPPHYYYQPAHVYGPYNRRRGRY